MAKLNRGLQERIDAQTREALRDIIPKIALGDDRACAILAAAWLEDYLAGILSVILVRVTDESAMDIFDGYGPLATFSAKIDVAYAMGIVPTDVAHDLRLVKNIRNAFAHDILVHSFEEAALKSRCGSFRLQAEEVIPHLAHTPRGKFIRCYLGIYAALQKALGRANERAEGEDGGSS